MKVYFDFEKFNLISDVFFKLYWFDKKIGCWREVGNFEFEDGSKWRWKWFFRVFFVGIVIFVIVREGFNFDVFSIWVVVRVMIDLYFCFFGSVGVVVWVIW